MTIAVMDGMGGGIGAGIISQIRKEIGNSVTVIALGTNSSATERMIHAGAGKGATGENAIRVMLRDADYIMGPIGIAFPNSLMGEVTPAMAEMVSLSPAKKILVPFNQPHYIIPGIEDRPLNEFIALAVKTLRDRLTDTGQ
jgi:hypothetical protein